MKTERKERGLTRARYIALICSLSLVFITFVVLAIFVPYNKAKAFFAILSLIEVLIIGWVLASFRFVAFAEKALAVILGGDPIYISGPKIVFVPRFPYTQFVKYPKKTFDFNDLPGNGFTRAGTYKGIYYEPEKVKVKGYGYIRIPDGLENLKKFHWAEIPKDDKGLENWLQEFADHLFWDLMPKFICREFFEAYSEDNEDKDLMKKVQLEINKMIKDACGENGILGKVGFTFDNIGIGIRDLEWREELVNKMGSVNTEEFESKAAAKEARQRTTESMGVYVGNMTVAQGGDIEKPEERYKVTDIDEAKELSKEFTEQQMALRAKAMQRVDIHTPGKSEGPLDWITAAKLITGGIASLEQSSEQDKQEKRPDSASLDSDDKTHKGFKRADKVGYEEWKKDRTRKRRSRRRPSAGGYEEEEEEQGQQE